MKYLIQQWKKETVKGGIYLLIGLFLFSFACEKCNDQKENLPAYRIESTNQMTVKIRTKQVLNKDEIISITSYLRDDYPSDEQRMFEFRLENDTFLKTVYYPSSESTKEMCKDKDKKGRKLEFRDDWDKF